MDARELAAQGLTNAEIFAELGYSSGELKRHLGINHQLMFDIIQGRRDFIEPHMTALMEIAMGISDLPKSAYAAILVLIERTDVQNRALCIGYDMALLEQAPSLMPTTPMDAMQLTAALRATK